MVHYSRNFATTKKSSQNLRTKLFHIKNKIQTNKKSYRLNKENRTRVPNSMGDIAKFPCTQHVEESTELKSKFSSSFLLCVLIAIQLSISNPKASARKNQFSPKNGSSWHSTRISRFREQRRNRKPGSFRRRRIQQERGKQKALFLFV